MAPAGDATAADAARAAPLVTVVVATLNSRVTLALALESIRRQTFQDFEVRVVGDACTDGSADVIAALADARFHWTNFAVNSGSQSEPNNEGARQARGRYIAYLGHDDLWFPWHLATLVDLATRDGAGLTHGLGAVLGPDTIMACGPPLRGASYRGHFVPPSNWLVDKVLLDQIGGWGPLHHVPRPIDVDVIDRLAATGTRVSCANRLTTIKFPSAWWHSYAAGAPRPQIEHSAALTHDPEALATRLLTAIAAEYARITFPTWTPAPRLVWREAARGVRRAASATARRLANVPIVSVWWSWRYQRIRRRARVARGLDRA